MLITFSSKSLKKSFSSEKELKKEWGNDRAKRIKQRLAELAAASVLDQMRFIPAAGFHKLEGSMAGLFAVDVAKNFRLIFKPDHNPVPLREDGGINLNQVTEIKVLRIEDYHGK